MTEQWKLVPVEPTEEMVAAAWNSDGADYVGEHHRIWHVSKAYDAMLDAAPQPPSVGAASAWREGTPPHPWDSEWFLAQMIDGSYAVLRPLPEDFTYAFTTADATYFMRNKVKRWAQLSDSNYIEPEDALSAQLAVSQARVAELERLVNGELKVGGSAWWHKVYELQALAQQVTK